MLFWSFSLVVDMASSSRLSPIHKSTFLSEPSFASTPAVPPLGEEMVERLGVSRVVAIRLACWLDASSVDSSLDLVARSRAR
jgi:hypothetical protein